MSDERRRFFRIDDEILVGFTPIEAADVDARIEDFWENEHAFSIRNNYNFQIEQHIGDFNKIDAKMPELGRYLGVLEKQIDRLTELLVKEDDDNSLQPMMVNISAQGMSFFSEIKPHADALAELRLKLLPSGQRLVIIARVVLVGTDIDLEQNGYRVSLDFEHLHEADREILIKHIHGKQMEILGSAQES